MKVEGCPFCGVDGDNVNCYKVDRYWVHCLNCHAAGPIRDTEEEAVGMWNKVSEVCKRVRVEVF